MGSRVNNRTMRVLSMNRTQLFRLEISITRPTGRPDYPRCAGERRAQRKECLFARYIEMPETGQLFKTATKRKQKPSRKN